MEKNLIFLQFNLGRCVYRASFGGNSVYDVHNVSWGKISKMCIGLTRVMFRFQQKDADYDTSICNGDNDNEDIDGLGRRHLCAAVEPVEL